MKQFTIKCDLNGEQVTCPIWIGSIDNRTHPLRFQYEWLLTHHGIKIPDEVMDSVGTLHKLAKEIDVFVEDLCVYALGTKEDQVELDRLCNLGHQENKKSYSSSNTEKKTKSFDDYDTKITNNALTPHKSNILIDLQEQISTLPLSSQARKIAKEQLHLFCGNIGDDGKSIAYLKNLLDLPWGKYSSNKLDLHKILQILDQDHFGLHEVKDAILESLILSKNNDNGKLPILCLVGSPGVGKTSIAHGIAKALNRPHVSLPLGGMYDSSAIRGVMKFYTGAAPGKILSLIKLAESWSPVMILDEIDKIDSRNKSSIEGALLALLDPAQNDKFCDEYFDIPFDLSKVFFIATANSIDDISYPLRNRMEIIKIGGYTDGEKLEIAKKHLIPKILNQAGTDKRAIKFSDQIIAELIKNYTRESGVRELDRLLKSLIQKYLLAKEFGKKPNLNMELIESYFADKKQDLVNISQEPIVGTVNGLAWTAMGGELLKIEARVISGSGKIKATGSLGKSLQESIDAAYSCVVGDLSMRGIKLLDTKSSDIHVHLPSGATPKDGASAGITIYTALVSIITERAVSQQIAMTGEITLRGQVLAIGGLKEKLSAAVRDNAKTVIIPAANKKDLGKIPKEITDHLEIKTISTSLELLEMLLDKYMEAKSTNVVS